MGCCSSRGDEVPLEVKLEKFLTNNHFLGPLLDDVSDEQLQDFLNSKDIVSIEAGTILVSEGDLGQELYYILEGTFERRKGGRVLGTFEGERSIGESAFLRGVPYEETVIVTRSAEICIFSRKKFDKIVMATEKYFSTVPVLCQLSSSDCKLLLDSTKLVKFAKGEFVIRRGDVANQFYIIIKGVVTVEKIALKSMQFFGHEAILVNGRHLYSAFVTKTATLLAITAEAFNSFTFVNARKKIESEGSVVPLSYSGSQSVSRSSTLRFLIVDDDESSKSIRTLIEKIFGYTAESAEDGAEALRLVRKSMVEGEPYDVVIMGFHLPVMDGPTACRSMLSEVGYQGKVLGIADHPNECQRYLDCGAALVADRPVGAHYVTQIISEARAARCESDSGFLKKQQELEKKSTKKSKDSGSKRERDRPELIRASDESTPRSLQPLVQTAAAVGSVPMMVRYMVPQALSLSPQQQDQWPGGSLTVLRPVDGKARKIKKEKGSKGSGQTNESSAVTSTGGILDMWSLTAWGPSTTDDGAVEPGSSTSSTTGSVSSFVTSASMDNNALSSILALLACEAGHEDDDGDMRLATASLEGRTVGGLHSTDFSDDED